MREHINDTFVQQAKAAGYRARAAFKLKEIDEKDHLIRPMPITALIRNLLQQMLILVFAIAIAILQPIHPLAVRRADI